MRLIIIEWENQKAVKPMNCSAIKPKSWLSSLKFFSTKPPNQRPTPIPVPSATIATVEIAAVEPTRSFNRAADQNDVANSDEMHATKPTQANQYFADNFPLCGPLSSGT